MSESKNSYHHGDLRSALIDTAIQMLSEVGVEKVSLRGVAKRAGVSQAAPYYHFRNKDDLLDAVGAKGFKELRASLLSHADKEEDHTLGMGVGYVMFAVKNPALFRLMQGSYFNDRTNALQTAAAAEASIAALTKGIRQSSPNASEEQLKIKATAAWAIVHGLATLMIDGRLNRVFPEPIDAEAIARIVTDQLDLDK